MIDIPKHKQLILFDGICNLCNTSIQYVIKHDKKNVFMFAALQSNIGQQVIKAYQIDPAKTDSILLYSKENGLTIKSTAALKISKHLGFPRNLLSVFLIIPAFLRNLVYDYIAKNRYKWYGKKDQCMIPNPQIQDKFLN